MMSVEEYALDVNKTVNEILELCKKLNINVSSKDDELDDEQITELDNEISQEEDDDELEYEEQLIEKENKKQENIISNSKQKKQAQPINLNKFKVICFSGISCPFNLK